MKINKWILGLAAITALALALPASAQVTTKTVGTFSGGTNIVAATTTNTYAASISTAGVNIDKGSIVSFSTQFKCMAANSGVLNLVIVPTDSSTNGSTIASEAIAFSVACNGTTQVNSVTNLNIGAHPTFLIKSAGNTGASAITNLQFRVSYKTGI